MKVVIIDDDPLVLLLLNKQLQRLGHEVITYDNPLKCPIYTSSQCPCVPEAHCPDIIITDVDMPIVNGMKLIETVVKKGCKCKGLALISGRGLEMTDMKRMATIGAKFFTKPLDFNEFDVWLNEPKGS